MRRPLVQIFDLTSVDDITYSLLPTRAIVPHVGSSIYFADLKSLFKLVEESSQYMKIFAALKKESPRVLLFQ